MTKPAIVSVSASSIGCAKVGTSLRVDTILHTVIHLNNNLFQRAHAMHITLPHFLKPALANGHPWVYRDHVPRHFSAPSGAWVEVQAGNWRGYALWDERSPIALRVYSQRRAPDAAWLAQRVAAAWAVRQPLRQRGDNTAFRWLFGEGDGLPGLTVDLYNDVAVVATYADSVETLLPWLCEALRQTTPLRSILHRTNDEESGALRGKVALLWGDWPSREFIVQEYGLRMRVDLYEGQKTGLFLDQRENRHWLAPHTAGKRLLNLFAYSGGFSLHAARAGAAQTTSVDIAPAAAEDAQRNFALNGLDPAAHRFVVADVWDFLDEAQRHRERWEVVVCDPPSFARNKGQLKQAIRAYTKLNAQAMRATAPGGLYVASSCTSYVSPDAFRALLADAARQAGRRFQLIHDAGHALDHPVMAHHPEGRYLKFMVGHVPAMV